MLTDFNLLRLRLREFSHVIVINVYVPATANATEAANIIVDVDHHHDHVRNLHGHWHCLDSSNSLTHFKIISSNILTINSDDPPCALAWCVPTTFCQLQLQIQIESSTPESRCRNNRHSHSHRGLQVQPLQSKLKSKQSPASIQTASEVHIPCTLDLFYCSTKATFGPLKP